ncbi:MAG: TMEM175 family protein, partial [Bacteroidota bacterium]
MLTNYNLIAGQNVKRIEALSDGVFAIALTLLVLEIKVPEVHAQTEKDLLNALGELTPKFLSYFLSFMTMGIFWTGQALQLSYIENYNRDLNWNSLFFLLCVSLLPFTTAFLGQYTTFKLAIGIYWLNILLLGMLLFIHWNYAYKNGFISVKGDQLENINKAVRKRIIIAQLLYL